MVAAIEFAIANDPLSVTASVSALATGVTGSPGRNERRALLAMAMEPAFSVPPFRLNVPAVTFNTPLGLGEPPVPARVRLAPATSMMVAPASPYVQPASSREARSVDAKVRWRRQCPRRSSP